MFRISDARVISLILQSRNHLESSISKFETDKFLSPMGLMLLLFVFVFALKGVLYPLKDLTLTHKHGDVKTPARMFFDQKTFDAKGKDKTP